jgi:deoxyribonuclease V
MGSLEYSNDYAAHYQLQKELSKKVIADDRPGKSIRRIAGTDVEYEKHSDMIVGAIVTLDYETREVVEKVWHKMKATFPYVPGLFSFREMPPLLEAFKKLQEKPDVIICDAQGIAHPRRFGLACHLGITLDIPAIGCAKSRLYGTYQNLGPLRGDRADLWDENTGTVIGKVLRTQDNVNPVFVSIGHNVSLETACQLVLHVTSSYRLPETTRLADACAREAMELF